MNCNNCGAPLTLVWDKTYFECDYCKSLYFPDENKDYVHSLEKATDVACPVCQHQLVHAVVEETRVLHCPNCKGLLVNTFVFFPTILLIRSRINGPELPPRILDKDELKRELECPLCHKPMDTHPYAGPGNIIIDTCNPCGVNWLDYGELYKIVNAPGRNQINLM